MSAEIYSYTLTNGMVIVGEPTTAVESIAFTLSLPAGCCYESPDRAGLAALTCDMMLRGCGPRDSRAFVTDLENLGVERGESVGIAQTTFGAATLHDKLDAALEIFADLVRRPRLPADQLDAARSVCLHELQAVEDDPGHKLMVELRRQHYPDPWGRTSQGDESGLISTTIDDVRAFHARHHQPGGAILALAGRFDWNHVCKSAQRLFNDWKPGPGGEPTAATRNGAPTHIPYESNQCHVGIAYPTIPYRHPDYFQAWAAVGVLSSGMSSRLFTEVREKRGLCYTVHASLHTQRELASVLCYAGTTAERAQETLDVTCAELVRLGKGIEPNELQRLQARIKSGLILQQESSAARSSALARDWYHLGRARSLVEIGSIVDALTADTINGFLAKNPPRTFTIVTLGPEPLELPDGIS